MGSNLDVADGDVSTEANFDVGSGILDPVLVTSDGMESLGRGVVSGGFIGGRKWGATGRAVGEL